MKNARVLMLVPGLIFCCLTAKNRGLVNCYNRSCFFNSSMQAISHFNDLNNLVKAHKSDVLDLQIYDGMMSKLKDSKNETPIK